MLTPLEVNNKEFKTRFRGYDVDEVEEFLEILSKDYEQLYKQNAMFTDTFERDRTECQSAEARRIWRTR